MRLRVALVCTMLVLAGCSTLVGGSGYPPGTNATHVNETALLEGHQAALDNRSFTVVVTWRSNETGFDDPRTVHRVDDGGEPFHVTKTAENHTFELYGNDSRVYWRWERAGGDVVYQVFDPDADGQEIDESFDATGFESALLVPQLNYTSVSRESELLGPTIFVFGADSYDESAGGSRPPGSAVEGTLRVRGDGLVRSYDRRTRYASGWLNVTVRLTEVGDTTVAEPEWLEEARANASTGGGDRTTPE